MRRPFVGIRRIRAYAAVLLLCLTAIAASATAAGHRAHTQLNLLRNAGGGVGAFSVQGWDSVTIPGWQVRRGLPTVVRYATKGFPAAARGWNRHGRLFAGGPGGTATLQQTVSLRYPHGQLPSRGAKYRLSGWLGGNRTSAASLTALFLSATGRVLGRRRIGPVGWTTPAHVAQRHAVGALPRGAAGARIVVRLATSLRNYDGPDAPLAGYDRAVAGRLSFSISGSVRRPARLAPPRADVPRFAHVFLFMFENQDYRAVVGNRRLAPYLNSLIPHGALLANLFAEEHPSDANYLAIAAGGAFGLPLTDPLEINPRFNVHARNIGDLIDSAHETWRAYLQSADGPCDDTVHGYYWNDDLPFLYFREIRHRPAYCAAHVVPLEAMSADLASPRTTPSFAWIAADDCSDMEGCGIGSGDRFLAQTLGQILRSPAWRTQRSLAIITFDEDAYDHQRPPQRVPTLVLGSSDVRQGFVSHVRYTHYSLLRTIEAALGLGTLTANDRYAQPLNDIFKPGARGFSAASLPPLAPSPASPTAPAPIRRAQIRTRAATASAPHETALVANYQSGTVTPVSLRTHRAGKPIRVGSRPDAIALTPGGRTAYVANSGSGTVTPIDTATMRAGPTIAVGSDPCAIAVSRTEHAAYVVNGGSDSVTPIDTVTGRSGAPIHVGADPRVIAIAPNGRTAYVLNWGGGSVTPIDLATGSAEAAISVGSYPVAITFSPGGATAYVANYGSGTITPFSTVTGRAASPIPAGQTPDALVRSPGGAKLMAVRGDTDSVVRISTGTGRSGRPIRVGYSPVAVARAPGSATAWVVSSIAGTATPISTSTGRPGRPVSVGIYSYPTSITFAPGKDKAVVLDTYAGRISILNAHSHRASKAIRVGSYPDAVAITP